MSYRQRVLRSIAASEEDTYHGGDVSKRRIMKLTSALQCDVCVIGSGLAGCLAALEAAEAGGRVCLASTGPLFSGSSFFEGTWGLGCIAPDGPEMAEDLVQTILDVGCGVADEQLVRTFVGAIPNALAGLGNRGAALRMPDASAEREYIPCFDRTHRLWRGLERASLKNVLTRELDEKGVALLSGYILVDIIEEGQAQVGKPANERGSVVGAVFYDSSKRRFLAVNAAAIVLATGGLGGLWGHHLTRDDCLGSAQAVALAHGEELVNIEFLQIMPTVITPRGPAVFNEKCFRYSELSIGMDRDLLDSRSMHGPFTSRLVSRDVDLALASSSDPVTVRIDRLPEAEPEFITTYRTWYEEATGLALETPIELHHFAHASNGGILIDEAGACRLPGLFAAGECTGGMHEADRIGGLASASILVFGRRAGRSAGAYACTHNRDRHGFSIELEEGAGVEAGAVDRALGEMLDTHALVIRTGDELARAERELAELGRSGQLPLITRQRILSARAMVAAMYARNESRGAHYRADYPGSDPEQARPLAVSMTSEGILHIEPAVYR